MPSLSGAVAIVKWSYLTVATVHDFTVTRDDAKQLHVSGRLTTLHPLASGQTDLIFVAAHVAGAWRFPILDPLPDQPGPFAVRLGSQLKE